MEFSKIVQFGVSGWVKDKPTIKYGIILFVIISIISLIFSYFMGGFMKGLINLQTNPSAFLTLFGPFALGIFIYFLIYTIGVSICEYLFYTRALATKKRSFVPISAFRVIVIIFYSFISLIIAAVSLFNVKFLLIGIGSIVALILGMILLAVGFAIPGVGILGGILILVGLLLGFVYFLIVIYNNIRQSLGVIAYVEKDIGVIESLRKSWEVTKGNVVNLVFVWIIAIIVIWIISAALSFPATIYQQLSFTTIDPSTTPELLIEKIFSDPIYMILQLPSYLGTILATIIGAFTLTAIYTELTSKVEKPKTTPKKVVKKKK